MPYDPGPQRKAKAAAMVNALDQARRAHSPETPWPTVAERLAAYTPGDWRQLSVAAGRPNRVPSDDTKREVTNTVAAMASAWQSPRTLAEEHALFDRLGAP